MKGWVFRTVCVGGLALLAWALGVAEAGAAPKVKESVEMVDTNPIPHIVIPPSPVKSPSARLRVALKNFENPAKVSEETAGIVADRMAELLGWTGRCRVYEGANATNVTYSIEGTIRRYSITNFQTVSSKKSGALLGTLTKKLIKVNGEQVDWGKASWDDTNRIVQVNCEFSLRFKRASDGETIHTATGGFTRTSSMKSMAADLALFEMKRDTQTLGGTEAGVPNGAFVQGRIIQVALGDALLKLIPKLDDELRGGIN